MIQTKLKSQKLERWVIICNFQNNQLICAKFSVDNTRFTKICILGSLNSNLYRKIHYVEPFSDQFLRLGDENWKGPNPEKKEDRSVKKKEGAQNHRAKLVSTIFLEQKSIQVIEVWVFTSVGGYHETRIIEFIRLGYICSMIDQIFGNIQTTIKTRSSQRSGQWHCRMIDISSGSHKSLYNIKVAVSYMYMIEN